MSRQAIHTERAPAAIGPYSQAIGITLGSGERLIMTAMQIGLDPDTMEIVVGGIGAETERVIENLTAVLGEAGAGWEDVVKAVVYLADISVPTRLYEQLDLNVPALFMTDTVAKVDVADGVAILVV